MYQAMTSAGWTFRLYTSNRNQYIPKVWALFTPISYAICGYNTKIPDTPSKDEQYTENYHILHALAPEIGLAVRSWRIILSYRFQYRYVLNKETPLSDNFGSPKNLFGIGFCW